MFLVEDVKKNVPTSSTLKTRCVPQYSKHVNLLALGLPVSLYQFALARGDSLIAPVVSGVTEILE